MGGICYIWVSASCRGRVGWVMYWGVGYGGVG